MQSHVGAGHVEDGGDIPAICPENFLHFLIIARGKQLPSHISDSQCKFQEHCGFFSQRIPVIPGLQFALNNPKSVSLSVNSQIKFWQMIGRGTRCNEACMHFEWRPNGKKEEFLIVD